MILPVYVYGHPVLKKECEDIDKDYPELEKFISDMWETMRHAKGVGIAAPQVGKAIRIFVIDSTPMYPEDEQDKGVKKVFINATIEEEWGKEWAYEEGCLSIPGINGDVVRPSNIKIHYYDENFKEHVEEYDGMNARVIQHEYDHVEGVLFTEHLKPLKRRMLKNKLAAMIKGKAAAHYKLRFANGRM